MGSNIFYIDELGAQYSEDKLTLMHLPNGLKQYTLIECCISVDKAALLECKTLEELTLPKSVTKLPKGVFDSGCPNLRKVTSFCESESEGLCLWPLLEKSAQLQELCVVSWEFHVLLTKFPDIVKSISEDRLNLIRENGFIYNSDKTILVRYEGGEEVVNIPEGIERICHESFKNNLNVIEITFPLSLKWIDPGVFDLNYNLHKVKAPSNYPSITCYTISCIPNLRAIYLPIGISHETKLHYQGSLNSIGNYKCEITIEEENFDKGIIGDLEDKAQYGFNVNNDLILCYVPNGIKTYTIKDGVKDIKADAFRDCDTLQELTIPASVTRLPKDLFQYRCYNLRKLTVFAESIENNYLNLLSGHTLIEELNLVPWRLPDDTSYNVLVRSYPYLRIKPISEVRLNLIKEDGFVYDSTKTILLRDENEREKVNVIEGVKIIISDAFKNNLYVKELVLPGSLEDIEWGAFDHTPNLHSVILVGGQKFVEVNQIPNIKKIYLPVEAGTKGFYQIGLKLGAEIKALDEWQAINRVIAENERQTLIDIQPKIVEEFKPIIKSNREIVIHDDLNKNKIENNSHIQKENKYTGFDGQVREWPIGHYFENNGSLKFNNLYSSKHSINDIMKLVAIGYTVQLQDGDDEEIRFLKRVGKVIDEPLGELIGLYIKDGKLQHLYEGKLIEIKGKGFDYVVRL